MSDNKRPPGYIPLTIHELAASNRGKKGTGLDYVYSLDSRAIDESVLGSSAARAATGMRAPQGGTGSGSRPQGGGYQSNGDSQGQGGRRRNRRNRGGGGGRRGGRGDFGGPGGDGDWGGDDGSEGNFSNGNGGGAEAPVAQAAPAGSDDE